MTTLSVAYIVRDEMFMLPTSLEQAERIADEIVMVLDTRSIDGTREFLEEKKEKDARYKVYERGWDTGAKQKQFALENCTMKWVLFLDGDEVLTDNCIIIKQVITEYDSNDKIETFDLLGHHFIYSLRTEDAFNAVHIWERRLLKRLPNIEYKGQNHAILTGYRMNPMRSTELDKVRIMHYGYVKHLQKIMDKFNEDILVKQFHSDNFLYRWKDNHLLGAYPVREYKGTHPKCVLKKFKLEYWDDLEYFAKRTLLESKFWTDAHYFIKFFNPETVLDAGCGLGQRVYALRTMGIKAYGFDLSLFAVMETPLNDIAEVLKQGDVTEKIPYEQEFDLVVAYDLLEHILEEKLESALKNLLKVGKKFVFSICFEQDPNWELDSTHKIRWNREKWQGFLQSQGFKLLPTPQGMPYAHQIIICEKEERLS